MLAWFLLEGTLGSRMWPGKKTGRPMGGSGVVFFVLHVLSYHLCRKGPFVMLVPTMLPEVALVLNERRVSRGFR